MTRRFFKAPGCALLAAATLASFATGTHAQTNAQVQEMVATVSQERVTSYVQTLQDFTSRYTFHAGNTNAKNWLHDFFSGLGIEVELHSFVYASQTYQNVIARITGSTHPEEIVAIAGHFDSMSEQPNTSAPGADDNATAIASVLEAALILRNYQFDRTIEFHCYNVEEQGRRGSQAVAIDYLAQGRNLVGVINSDMIGYWPTGWARDLDVAYEPVSEWLADHVVSASNRYVGIPIAKHLSGVCRDDHVSFTDRGIAAITNMDCWQAHNGGQGGESTPHYHRATDTVATLNLPCFTQCVQVNIAALAELAGPLDPAAVETDGPRPLLAMHNQPNPFAGRTEITFVSPGSGESLAIRVYDTDGKLVRTVAQRPFSAGAYQVEWDGRDDAGSSVASGVYFYRMESAAGAIEGSGRAILLH